MKLTLLVRAYCHLCDEMSEDLAPLLASCDATVELLDVDADPVLEARWGDKVPAYGSTMCGDELAELRDLLFHPGAAGEPRRTRSTGVFHGSRNVAISSPERCRVESARCSRWGAR